MLKSSFRSTRRLFCLVTSALLLGQISAQERVDNYFVLDQKDTVLCKSMRYDPGSINKMLVYVRWGGAEEERMSSKEFKQVSTFFRDGIVQERLPVHPDDPKGKSRLMQRVANGRLKLYDLGYSEANGRQQLYLILRTPDGELLDVTDNQDLEKKINPLLERCAEYRTAFRESFDLKKSKDLWPQAEEMAKRVRFYNDNCQ